MLSSNNRKANNRLFATIFAVTAAIFISACASAPIAPESSMTKAQEAIALAERAGARQYAGAELDEAQQKLISAEKAIASEEMLKADRLAQESIVVAELALARTESTKALDINQEMRRSTDALIEEMQRVGE